MEQVYHGLESGEVDCVAGIPLCWGMPAHLHVLWGWFEMPPRACKSSTATMLTNKHMFPRCIVDAVVVIRKPDSEGMRLSNSALCSFTSSLLQYCSPSSSQWSSSYDNEERGVTSGSGVGQCFRVNENPTVCGVSRKR